MKKFVQPDPSTGYRFTSYRLEGEGEWPFTETGYVYHKIDLSDLAEPYLSAVKKSLENDSTPKETSHVSKIEQVARAMWEKRRETVKFGFIPVGDINAVIELEEWGDGSVPRMNGVFEEARAAIEAMREPTGGMYDAYRCDKMWHELDSKQVWRLWIDAALAENDSGVILATETSILHHPV